tara:strand:- start:25358 stop:25573 length:216 start_codon:yes stop_codon:yes gene_type:complete
MIEYLIANWDAVLTTLLSVIGALAMIAKFTPTPKDDAILGKLYDLISAITPNDRVKKVDEVKDSVNPTTKE